MADFSESSLRKLEETDSREFARWDEMTRCFPPEILEGLNNRMTLEDAPGDYFKRKDQSHLQNMRLDLNLLDLTDKQLIAISLVFYGGLKKRRAARAMSISSQALTEHIQAGLKKILKSL